MPLGGLVVLVCPGLLLAFAAAQVAGWLLQPPRQPIRRTPAALGLSYEDVTLCSKDGVHLTGWWIPALSQGAGLAGPVVILLHPMLGNREGAAPGSPGLPTTWAQGLDLLAVAQRFHAAGYACLLVDFRNHGASDAGLTTGGYTEDQDVLAAVHYAFARLAAPPGGQPPVVGLVGFGLGAAAALSAIGREPGDASLIRVFSADTEGSAGLIAFEPAPVKRLNFVAIVDLAPARTVLRRRLGSATWLIEPFVAHLYTRRSGYPLDGSLLPRYARHVYTPTFWGDSGDSPDHNVATIFPLLPGPKRRLLLAGDHTATADPAGVVCDQLVDFALAQCSVVQTEVHGEHP